MSRSKAAFARATAFLLLIAFLPCIWGQLPTGIQDAAPVSGMETTRHAQGTEEGEAPRPTIDHEMALKKRRSQPSEAVPADLPAETGITKAFPTDDPASHSLEAATRSAYQHYASACELRLDDPDLRLHPGHAPPCLTGSAG